MSLAPLQGYLSDQSSSCFAWGIKDGLPGRRPQRATLAVRLGQLRPGAPRRLFDRDVARQHAEVLLLAQLGAWQLGAMLAPARGSSVSSMPSAAQGAAPLSALSPGEAEAEASAGGLAAAVVSWACEVAEVRGHIGLLNALNDTMRT